MPWFLRWNPLRCCRPLAERNNLADAGYRIKTGRTDRGDRLQVKVEYSLEPHLAADEFVDLLVRSTLAERRPVDDRQAIQAMLANAAIILTARADSLLVGVSRAISDFAYCTYLSDLAVDQRFQRRGIGRELIRRTHEAAGLSTSLVLLAAPKAENYYPHIGMTQWKSCWVIPRQIATEPKQ
jgi:GNAT superfamily N-acetyltransferase